MADTEMEIEQETAGLSRDDVIQDLCGQLTAELKKPNCSFRGTDAFTGYAAKITIELALSDFDIQTLHLFVEVPASTAEDVRKRTGRSAPDLAKPIV